MERHGTINHGKRQKHYRGKSMKRKVDLSFYIACVGWAYLAVRIFLFLMGVDL